MLTPQELISHKEFKKTMRGYAPNEVDDYIDLLIKNYEDLYKQKAALEKELKDTIDKYDNIKDEATSIRETLLRATKLRDRIIKDANEKADSITNSIKYRCEEILSDFRRQFAEEKAEMWKLRTKVIDFKTNLYDLYRAHIEELQSISVNEIEDIVLPDDKKLVAEVISDVKSKLADELEEEKRRKIDSGDEDSDDDETAPKSIRTSDSDGKPNPDDDGTVYTDDIYSDAPIDTHEDESTDSESTESDDDDNDTDDIPEESSKGKLGGVSAFGHFASPEKSEETEDKNDESKKSKSKAKPSSDITAEEFVDLLTNMDS